MTVDMRAIEDMLYKYYKRVEEEVRGEGNRLLALPTPETQGGSDALAAQLSAAADDCEHMEEVRATYSAMREARQATDRELFAGAWPPTNPLDMLAMWTTLLSDIDDIDRDYFDVDGYCDHPLLKAWGVVDAAMLKLEPDTVEAATAIKFGAARDIAEAGGLMNWDEERVDRAKKLGLAVLPRPR